MAEKTQRKNSNALIIALIAVIVIAIAVAGVLIARSASASKSAEAAASVTQTADPALAMPAVEDKEAMEYVKGLATRTEGDPLAIGDKDAPVVMLEFSDFSCPQCSEWAVNKYPELAQYIESGVLRIEYHDFVIFDQQYSSGLAALGAWAAGQQGKFWEYYEAGMQKSLDSHFNWDVDSVAALAQQVGVADMAKFESDINSQAAAMSVQANTMLAQQLGFTGTPAFLVNNRGIGGNADIDTFKATIEAAAADVAAGKF